MKISLKNIYVSYQNSNTITKWVLFDATITVKSNEFLCIFGPTGSGKTTLLNVISGLIKPRAGNVSFLPNKIPKIGYVFQEHRLFPWLNVFNNVSVVMDKYPRNRIELTKQLINDYLAIFGLNNKKDSYPRQLSGGECQRVSIVRALVNNPDILLLDEPFIHLDEDTSQKLREKIRVLIEQRSLTTVFVTHNPYEAVFLADRIIVISEKNMGIEKEIIIKINKADRKLSYASFIHLKSTAKYTSMLLKSLKPNILGTVSRSVLV
jgi:ABC-type nitrate/sulfonate/bicarbonate transport system ATPase subunit